MRREERRRRKERKGSGEVERQNWCGSREVGRWPKEYVRKGGDKARKISDRDNESKFWHAYNLNGPLADVAVNNRNGTLKGTHRSPRAGWPSHQPNL